MSRAALTEALRARAAQDADAIWAQARADAEAYRQELARSLDGERQARLQAAATAACERDALATEAARRQARELGMRARLALAERLYRLAVAELPQLAGASREALFATLADEVPPLAWQRVRVNPRDLDLARRRFPSAAIVGDQHIAGGLEVEAGDGSVRVSNTLEARLETAWPDLLPDLVAQLAGSPAAHAPAP